MNRSFVPFLSGSALLVQKEETTVQTSRFSAISPSTSAKIDVCPLLSCLSLANCLCSALYLYCGTSVHFFNSPEATQRTRATASPPTEATGRADRSPVSGCGTEADESGRKRSVVRGFEGLKRSEAQKEWDQTRLNGHVPVNPVAAAKATCTTASWSAGLTKSAKRPSMCSLEICSSFVSISCLRVTLVPKYYPISEAGGD